jgi:small subunit ribosomal protein S6
LAVNIYECMLILDSNHYAREPDTVSQQITEFVEKRGGEVMVSRLWEERRLAYPIEGHRKGTYWLAYFNLPGSEVTGLQRDFQLATGILRNLTLKVDPRIAETLISHAQGKTVAAPPAAETAEESDDEKADTPDADALETDETESEESSAASATES